MWRREELKSLAKQNLHNKYWMAFLVSLIVSLLGSGSNMLSFRFNSFQRNSDQTGGFFGGFGSLFGLDGMPGYDSRMVAGFLIILAGFIIIAGLFAIAFTIFVRTVIQVGGNRWFSRSRESAATPSIGQIFSLFKAGSYLKTVAGMLWMNLFLFLWGLLASIPIMAAMILLIVKSFTTSDMQAEIEQIPDYLNRLFGNNIGAMIGVALLLLFGSILLSIPAIIKQYSYRMTPWILADNPKIGYRRALKLSMQLTAGQKGKMFVLDLSFIGWFLLGVIACGIGVLFVTPYYMAVQAELYARLRQNGVEKAYCTMEDFGYFQVVPTGADSGL